MCGLNYLFPLRGEPQWGLQIGHLKPSGWLAGAMLNEAQGTPRAKVSKARRRNQQLAG